jgi:hypothetical protein
MTDRLDTILGPAEHSETDDCMANGQGGGLNASGRKRQKLRWGNTRFFFTIWTEYGHGADNENGMWGMQ